jgi:ABC-type Fe3+/spermidine/putrescine transport system ATPase subunit
MEALRLTDINKSYEDNHVLAGISFDIHKGEIVAILGPSGCGKSTLLMLIAGIEKQDSGDIYWDGALINEVPPHRRGFGLMFQDYVLFPHMSVHENVAFGLKMNGLGKSPVEERAAAVMDLVGLKGFGGRDVSSLSGGEQQRVAMARSLAPNPKLLMLDEPLASLDRSLRERLIDDLRRILRDLQQTAIYVTHDQEEAFAIADRIVLLQEGRIEQIGRPEEIYSLPATLFVANFLGLTNTLSGTAVFRENQYLVETKLGNFPLENPIEGPVTVLLRHDAAILDDHGEIKLHGRLIEKSFRGNICQAVIEVNGTELEFNFLSTTELPTEGEQIQITINPQQALLVYPSE